ncbi:MAG: hypothetical protein MZW92_71615 [Comamonadaceae bacterium]|nr:hypothetical protein [Comamonadaceae bacterium]
MRPTSPAGSPASASASLLTDLDPQLSATRVARAPAAAVPAPSARAPGAEAVATTRARLRSGRSSTAPAGNPRRRSQARR